MIYKDETPNNQCLETICKTMSKPEEELYVNITCDQFDPEKLVIQPARKIPFNNGTTNFQSDIKYLNDDGEECTLFVIFPKQYCFGLSYIHDKKIAEKDRNPDNAVSIDITYQVTTKETIETPTPEEEACITMCTQIYDACVNKGLEECKDAKSNLPKLSKDGFKMLSLDKDAPDPTQTLKPLISHPMVKDSDPPVLNEGSPLRLRAKLLVRGKGDKLAQKTIHTKLYNGDAVLKAADLIGVWGHITPCFKFECIYWGSHSPQPWCASLRVLLAEAQYVPSAAKGALPTKRLVSAPAAPATPEEVDDAEDTAPSSPLKALMAAKAKAGAPIKGKPPIAAKSAVAKPPVTKPPAKAAAPKPSVVAKPPPKPAVPKPPIKAPVVAKAAPPKPSMVKKPPPKPVPEPEPEPEPDVEEEDVEEEEVEIE